MLEEPSEHPVSTRSSRWREAWPRRSISPLVALGLHLAAAIVVWERPATLTSATNGGVANEGLAFEIVTERELGSNEPADTSPSAAHTRAREPARVARATGTAPRSMGEAAAGERSLDGVERASVGAQGSAAPEAESSAPAEGPSFVRPQTADIGVGGVNRFLPKSEREVETTNQRERDNLLRHTGWERDRALGLGPEGPVLTALSDATSQSVAPVRGRAIFVATTNAAGEVESLELLDAEGGRPGWADARRIAMATLAGRKLRIPPSAKRVQMKIEVVSAWKLPSGQDPGTDLTVFHIPVSKGEGKDSAKVSVLDPIPKVRIDYLEIGPGVKIPVPSVQLEIFSATTDPSNIGAKPRRVIHSHLVDSTIM